MTIYYVIIYVSINKGQQNWFKITLHVSLALLRALEIVDTLQNHLQATLDISKLRGPFFTSSNYPKCKCICTSGNLNL